MLIGAKKDSKAAGAQSGDIFPAAPSGNIFDVTTDQFEAAVLKASMETPVLVDFWAPWCGPCKQLGPMLEAAVTATNGKVKMAKVNVDENQDLAQAFRVQSIPTVYAFFQGQPVTAFTGAKSQSEIKALVDQLSKMAKQARPDALNIPEILSAAAKALADGDPMTAQNFYAQIFMQDETSVPAYTGMIRSFIALGDLEQAQYMVDDAPEAMTGDAAFTAARTALDLAQKAPKPGDLAKLQTLSDKDPDNHQARLDYALGLFGAGQKAEAIDQIIDIIRRDRGNEKKWQDDKARTELLKLFDAMGPADPATMAGRRKLSSLLFS